MVQNGKAVAYTSDVLYGLNLLCRQVEYIGEIKGPLTINMLKKCMSMISGCCKGKSPELIWRWPRRWQSGGDLIQLVDPVMGIMLAMSKYIPTAELEIFASAPLAAPLDQLKQAVTPRK